MQKGRLRVAWVFVNIALASSSIAAQDSTASSGPIDKDGRDQSVYSSPASGGFVKKFTSNVLLDQKAIWTGPFHTNKQNVKWWILAGIGTGGLLAADHRTSQAVPFSGTSVQTGNSLSRIGQWYSVFPAAGAIYFTGLLSDSPKLKQTGIESLEALADADIAVNVIKVVGRRQRPGDGDHGGHFEKGGSSFPSGHSTQAWALASVIADEYGSRKWVPMVAYGYAAAVSVSRVLAQAHFTSDVFVGSAIGFFIGRYVVHTQRMHQNHLGSGHADWRMPSSITPRFSPAGKTFAVAWNR